MDSFLGSKDDILKTLNVDPKVGLTEDGRKKSLEKYGANSFTKEKGATLIQKILESLKEPMILMLILLYRIRVLTKLRIMLKEKFLLQFFLIQVIFRQ